MRLTTFIYALCEPGTRTVRYIGKTDYLKKRFWYHLHESIKLETHQARWLRSLKTQGLVPEMIVLCEVPVADWQLEERRYIQAAHALGLKITNGTEGGEGLGNPSEETRRKIGDANRGKKRTPEVCAKISAGLKGIPKSAAHNAAVSAALMGKKYAPPSEETRAKLRLANTGQKRSAEQCAAMSAGRVGMKFTDEHRENLRKSHLGIKPPPCSDITRAKLRAANLGKRTGPQSEAHRAKISAKLKGKPKSDAHKANLKAAAARRREAKKINTF